MTETTTHETDETGAAETVEITPRMGLLLELNGGDTALASLAGQYAAVCDQDPSAFLAMLAIGQETMQRQIDDIHGLLSRVAPFVENPDAILASLPPGLRAMLGV